MFVGRAVARGRAGVEFRCLRWPSRPGVAAQPGGAGEEAAARPVSTQGPQSRLRRFGEPSFVESDTWGLLKLLSAVLTQSEGFNLASTRRR
jgi:hypothetical protein